MIKLIYIYEYVDGLIGVADFDSCTLF